MIVVKIADHVNDIIKKFQASGTPSFGASSEVKRADRYCRSWHENQRLIALMESCCNKAQTIPDKESLKVKF